MTNLGKIIKSASRAKASIRPKDIKGQTIISSLTIKEKKESSSIVSLNKIDTNEKKAIYQVQLIWWSYDDAGDDDFFFEKLEVAESCYNDLIKPMRELLSEETEPPVKIFVAGRGEVQKVATFHNGYLVQSLYGGDLLKPMFNQFVVSKLGFEKELKAMDSDTDIRELDPKYQPCLLKLGENEGGRIVSIDQTVHFETYNCWETGFDYCKIRYRYPKNVFDVMRSELEYHSEEIEEEGDWKGWYFLKHNKDKLKQKLQTINWNLA